MAPPKAETLSDAVKIQRLRSALSITLGALQGVRDAAGGFGASSSLNDTIRKAKKTLRETE